MISDFRVMADQQNLLGPVASVPTAWRALKEAADGGERLQRKVTRMVNRAQAAARHGGLPPVRVADKALEGVTCIRLDATVITAHRQGGRGGELQGLRPPPAAGRLR